MTDNKIKIYVSCHKDSYVPNNNLLYPIQVGTSLNSKIPGMAYYDNTGDNISDKNKSYCELTAQYWAWKNDEADYYGFFHYRRYFSFSDKKYETDTFGDIKVANNDDETLAEFNLNEESMKNIINQYDVIAPTLGGFVEKQLSLYQQYEIATFQEIKDLQYALNVIKLKYPDMYPIAEKYIHSNKGYFCNMFIMKKDIFDKYCEWLFDILQDCENNLDFTNYSVEAYRVIGFLAERLCGIYLTYLKSKPEVKFCELQKVFFESTEKTILPNPAFEKNNVPIVFSSNDNFIPYVSVAIQSIIQNSSPNNNYDIIILHNNVTPISQKMLLSQIDNKTNFSIRFLNISNLITNYQKLYVRGHFKMETYFRFLIPTILNAYKKVVYIDGDLVVQRDIADLFNIDIGENIIGASLDVDTMGLYCGAETGKKAYTDNIMKLKDPFKYFQAGVLLFNVEQMIKKCTTKQMLDKAQEYPWQLLDQDVLNILAQGQTYNFDMAWNVMFDWQNYRIKNIISRAPRQYFYQYMEARKKPYIIHYAGPDKPWQNPSCDFGMEFWKYAKMSPFCPVIIYSNIGSRTVIIPTKPSLKRRTLNFFFPIGSKRRKFAKKVYNKIFGRKKAKKTF